MILTERFLPASQPAGNKYSPYTSLDQIPTPMVAGNVASDLAITAARLGTTTTEALRQKVTNKPCTPDDESTRWVAYYSYPGSIMIGYANTRTIPVARTNDAHLLTLRTSILFAPLKQLLTIKQTLGVTAQNDGITPISFLQATLPYPKLAEKILADHEKKEDFPQIGAAAIFEHAVIQPTPMPFLSEASRTLPDDEIFPAYTNIAGTLTRQVIMLAGHSSEWPGAPDFFYTGDYD